MQPNRVALVGIDGAGKSTLVRDLRALTNGSGEVVTVHAPAYHEGPDTPLHKLSRHLHAASRVADKLGSFTSKALVLYLQMTLYGPIERFLLDTYRPGCVISDRHPLIDSMVYGHLYRRLIRDGAVQSHDWNGALRDRLEAERPGAYAALSAWIALHGRRVGSAGPRGLLNEVVAVFDQPASSVMAELAVRYQARLPQLIFLIDVEPGEALRRSGSLHEKRELHEKGVHLEELRARYEQVLSSLRCERPDLVVHRVTNPDGDRSAALTAILEHLALSAPL
jgi:thymidylate kinase